MRKFDDDSLISKCWKGKKPDDLFGEGLAAGRVLSSHANYSSA